MEKEQNLLSGPAIAKQTECLSICVTLLLEDVRRRWHSGRKKPSWWMERDLGCFRPGRKPPSLVTRQPLGLPSFLAWRCHPDGVGARSHPKAKYEQGGESGKEGVKADQFADRRYDIHFPHRPSFSIPPSRRRKVSRGQEL